VLNPAGLRQDLLVLELMLGRLVSRMIKEHEPRACGALVNGPDEIRHALLLE
jgi:hypothetical protein